MPKIKYPKMMAHKSDMKYLKIIALQKIYSQPEKIQILKTYTTLTITDLSINKTKSIQ